MSFLTSAIDRLCDFIAVTLDVNYFVVPGTIAIILVCLICGSVGSLVVGNRMAFFSDALAHCSFAGFSMAVIGAFLIGGRDDNTLLEWLVPLVMVTFGSLVGVGIAFVREKTALASDTVIGVFFAGALGIGVLLIGNLKKFSNKQVESFLFGNTSNVVAADLVWLVGLAAVTAAVLTLRYNHLVFASFNPSLARSRRIPFRLHHYMLVVLLALIVNLCLRIVGVILINAMLIVPAATASLLSRNLRQMFWFTVGISLATGMAGQWVSIHIRPNTVYGPLDLGTSGSVVVFNVLAFAAAMLLSPFIRGRQTR